MTNENRPIGLPTVPASGVATTSDAGYQRLKQLVRERIAAHEGPLFTTDASPAALWGAYLSGIPAAERQHFNCNACRRFVETYGGLVKIDAHGQKTCLLWGDSVLKAAVDFEPFDAPAANLCAIVERSKVTGVFLSSDSTWGTPRNRSQKDGREWEHLAGEPRGAHGSALMLGTPLKTAEQAMAEKLEDHGMLCRALADFSADATREAVRALEADALPRSEKALAMARWFHQRHEDRKKPGGSNLLWLAVATAPPGFAHVRATVLGNLLERIRAGQAFEEILDAWRAMVDPLNYQRPKAAPKAGAVAEAEKLVAKLGCERSLLRRYARLEEVPRDAFAWRPLTVAPADKDPGGTGAVFAHLRPEAEKILRRLELPPQRISWARFERDVLPGARTIEVQLPAVGKFYGMLTAQDPEAPPILQWDSPERRNPFSLYCKGQNGLSMPRAWELPAPGQGGARSPYWALARAILAAPCHWREPERFKHHTRCALFVLEGARDLNNDEACLFPEILRTEFHGIRSVIEAHSRSGQGKPAGAAEGDANGLAFTGNNETIVRVNGEQGDRWVLDRWD